MTDSEKLVVARLLAAIQMDRETQDLIIGSIEDDAINSTRALRYKAAYKRLHYTRLNLDAAMAAANELLAPAPVPAQV